MDVLAPCLAQGHIHPLRPIKEAKNRASRARRALALRGFEAEHVEALLELHVDGDAGGVEFLQIGGEFGADLALAVGELLGLGVVAVALDGQQRSEEHTSELQSLMRISYAG